MRRKTNEIIGIINATGSWTEDSLSIEETFISYFETQFESSNPNSDQIDYALEGLTPKGYSEHES